MLELEAILLQVPLQTPLTLQPGQPALAITPVYLVRVTSEGVTAYGEASLDDPGVFAEAVDFFADTLANGKPQDFGLLWQRMVSLVREYQPEPAHDYAGVMSAIDMALWDLAGRELGVPCCRLVGGTRAKRIDCYGGGLLATDPALAEKTTQLRRQFGAIELSLSGDVQRDLAAIKTVRRAAGEQAPLLVDAGGLYADIAQAQTVGAALEQAEVFWYQEPLPPGRWEEYATLRSALATPLVADKHLFGLKPFAQALQAGALDVALADLRLCGGMSAGRRLADLAWLHDARITFHAGVSGLAQLASAHLIAANWHAGPLQVQPSPAPLTELLDPAPVFKDGFLLLPEQPGLGAQVSEEFLNQYRVEVPQADLELPEDE